MDRDGSVGLADPSQLFEMDGRTVVVTGASSGLGRRFAGVLSAAGATVFAVARRSDLLASLAAESSGVVALQCDLADPAARIALVEQIRERCDRVDCLVNNAGLGGASAALDEEVEDFQAVLNVNVVAAFDLARLVVRHRRDDDPLSIVNVASIRAMVGVGQIPATSYASSKAGLVGLTRELAAQWGPDGIRVNAIAPGWFPTAMTGEALFSDERSVRWMASRTPLRRPGTAADLDGVLLLLASGASEYITGQVLTVDGGWTAL